MILRPGKIRRSGRVPEFYFFGDEVLIEHDTRFRTNLGRRCVPREWEDLIRRRGRVASCT
jgi:hypothetical protein